ncbi:MAG: twin-arginine translocase subunit TatC, partial [Deltaproteobacteria bacterium]|nr:twin-arginine translocase subunit TatC [Deltaproteobacteria bacterium]
MNESSEMPLLSHLGELRRRLIVSLLAVAVAFVFTYSFSEAIYSFLLAPLIPALPDEHRFMAFTGLVEPFFTYLKVGVAAAVLVSSPVVLYEVWAFIVPALLEKERRYLLPVIFFSVLLFSGGVFFAYYVVFPAAFKYLMSYSGPELRPVLSMTEYFSFIIKLLLAFGICFQVPLVMLVLSRIGIASARSFLRWWRYALLLAVVFGAVLTPPDVIS